MMIFSCSPELDLEADNLEATNAKSNKSVLKTLVEGASLNGANGLDVGPDGNLYVASVSGQNITVMNKNSGKIIRRLSEFVNSPDDLVFSPDGEYIYYTDILTGFVGKITPDGSLEGYQEVAPGVNPVRFSEPNPNDPESKPRLFVALDFLGDGIYELNPETLEPRPIILCPGGFCLGFFNSFDTRWENGRLWLYGPLFALNAVIAIDIDAFATGSEFPDFLGALLAGLADERIRIVAGDPFGPSDLFNPAAAKFGPDGMLYVLDQAGKFFKVNPDEEDDKTLISTLDPGLDNMTFDDDGSLYMTNNDEGWVAEILDNGQPRFLSPGGIIRPQGLVAMEGANNQEVLYEADLFNLRKFNGTNGRQLEQFKGFLIPEGPESLILPMNLSPDGDKIVVSSWFSGAVQVWDPSGEEDPENINYGPIIPQLAPIDAVRVNGDIYISDFFAGGIVKQGEAIPVVELGASGLASDGVKLWAADYNTGNIYEVDLSTEPPTKFTVAEGLSKPEGLALDHEGRLLVVETGTSSLLRFDFSDRSNIIKTTLAEGLEFDTGGIDGGAPATFFFDAVAVGPSGDIYVTGGGSNVIYKISQNKVR
ncbi:hypothetical protein [Sediminicola sp. YIK13]|uniref:hypothetical protein n=1 Tax=Sediminicola sp. YIK13 TaxID=1453352 RepID=UPI001F1D1D50|nr:hypothetical protein [Sediminicola sp. YIK13]